MATNFILTQIFRSKDTTKDESEDNEESQSAKGTAAEHRVKRPYYAIIYFRTLSACKPTINNFQSLKFSEVSISCDCDHGNIHPVASFFFYQHTVLEDNVLEFSRSIEFPPCSESDTGLMIQNDDRILFLFDLNC